MIGALVKRYWLQLLVVALIGMLALRWVTCWRSVLLRNHSLTGWSPALWFTLFSKLMVSAQSAPGGNIKNRRSYDFLYG